MFQGASSLNLDGKGRLSVPTRHRDALLSMAEGQVTFTKHPDGCLLLFPRPEWLQFRERVAQLPTSAQWWKRIFFFFFMDAEMDATGRVLISPELREATGLTKEVLMLGMGGHFEVWDKATYELREAEARQQPMPDAFQNFVL